MRHRSGSAVELSYQTQPIERNLLRMPSLFYRIYGLLAQVLTDVPLGTDLGLLHLFLALLSGHFLAARSYVSGTHRAWIGPGCGASC